ncbi:MAG: CaiB/BaiF CoA-transferase family protein [Chloroflexota bacterium]
MLALEGIKVVDLTHVAPGAYCTMILADLGADVLKVDPPPAARANMTGTGMSPIGEEGRREAAFYAPNRNKRSIALNLRSEEGKGILHRLAGRADVMVEGFSPGTVKRLGVDYETIARINPRVVYCSLSGYGQDGPYRDLPGHDINYIAMGGVLGLIGSERGAPALPQNLIADFAGGSLFAAIGILTALLARERTGRGQYLDLSMTDGVVSLLTWEATRYFREGKFQQRGTAMLGGAYPYYGVYETKDGKYLSIGCIEPRFWETLCRLLGREDYASYTFRPEHFTDKPRDRKWAEIKRFLEAKFITRTRQEWFDLLSGAGLPVGKVNAMDELFSDPQVLHRRMVLELDHPAVGKVRQVGIPVKLSETPGRVRSLSPVLGEHTDAVLKELGYSTEQIRGWREAGVVV